MEKILEILCCLECKGDLELSNEGLSCKRCLEKYPIIDNIARFVPEGYYKLTRDAQNIEEKTKNYFGFEWDYFKDWGFIPDESVSEEKRLEYTGGMVSSRKMAFDSKCRMTEEDLAENKIVLDAGCGNGRYTYEAATRGKALVIGVDIGYGSVLSAYQNTKDLDNVIILQASLFNLPFKDRVIDSAFSNGVLMHTGDAKKAFVEIARTVKSKGVFVAHLYHRLNPVWEFNDWLLRAFTTRLSIDSCLKLSKFLARVAKTVNHIPNGLRFTNLFLRLQPSIIHMYDWYSAPIATHHTYDEVEEWVGKTGFGIIESKKPDKERLLSKPWSLTVKGRKIQDG